MCTVSWLPGPGGYLLCFNRDENRLRQPGRAPTLRHVGTLEVIAPTDADAGGTWIGVNSAGVTVCLANLYGDIPAPPVAPVSRGLLVLGLLGHESLDLVAGQLDASDHTQFKPFTLITVEPNRAARIWRWDGTRLTDRNQSDPGLLVTSSAVDQEGAESSRRRQFEELLSGGTLSPVALTELHRSHRPSRGGLSVCMHRTDAQTVSLTRVEVTTDTISMAYTAGSPCHTPLAAPLMAMRQGIRTGG